MIILYNQNVWNQNPSEYRNGLMRSLIAEVDADICTFQECGPTTNRVGKAPLPELMSDCYLEACPEYAECNYTPVFYKKDKFELIDGGYFLYSGKNDMDSKSVTWAILKEIATNHTIAVISTHFWWMDVSQEDNLQRLQNAVELKNICDTIVEKYQVPVIIGGDFNNGKNSQAGDMPYQEMLKVGFSDIRLTAPITTDSYTHHEYPSLTEAETYVDGPKPDKNLDYIFTYGPHSVQVRQFDILTTQKALDSSDHCPLLGYFEWKQENNGDVPAFAHCN